MEYKLGEIFKKDDYDKMIEAISNRKYVKYTLKEGEKVYIHPKSEMPRLKFKKNFPSNKIVYNTENADVYIAGENIYYYTTNYSHALFNAKWALNSAGQHTYIYDSEVNIVTASDLINVNKMCSDYNIVSGEKPLIRDTDILYKGEIPRIMSSEEYDTISKMMGSGEKEMINLGLEILLGFDYTINEKNYVLILAQARNTYYLKKSRTYKAIVRTLKTKYINLR